MSAVPEMDVLVVGAGVVGAALAHALRNHGREVYWVEAEAAPGRGMTSRNSGVIHAGIYYPANSLKTELCRKGAKLLYEFAAQHKVAHSKPGKYLVAQTPDQETYLHQLKKQNQDVPLHWVQNLPAGIKASKALYSPNTGLIDQHALVETLIHASGIQPLYHQKVTSLQANAMGVEVKFGGDTYIAKEVFNCTGLAAAAFTQSAQHYFAQGAYFRLKPPTGMSLPALVYPAVPKKAASLGVHLTQNLAGESYLGPDLTWIDREHYRVDSLAVDRFHQAAQTYLPWLEPCMLEPGYAGIRAKLSRTGFSDFLIRREGGTEQLWHFLGIESPGLTAAMALAELVAAQVKRNV